MASIPLQWTLSIKGGNEVKTTLDQLTNSFKKGMINREEYNKSLAKGNRVASQALNVDRYQMNILKAQYPALQRVSRAMSTVTSISRSLLTISNALNISKIAGNTVDTGLIEIQNSLNANLRTRSDLLSKGMQGSREWIENEEEIILKTQELKNKNQELIDQKWDGMLTGIESTLFGVGTIFTNMINNPTIFKALTKAGGFFGGVFSGFFNLASKTGVAALDWMFPTLTGKNAMLGVTKSGTTLGTAFGWAFTVAAGIALASGAVLLIDVIEQKLFGTSKLRNLTGKSGAEQIKDMTGVDVLGFEPGGKNDPAVKRLHGDDIGSWLDKNFYNKIVQMAEGEMMNVSGGLQGPVQDTGLRPSINSVVTKANTEQVEKNTKTLIDNGVTFKDLNHEIQENNKIMIIGNTATENYNRYIQEFGKNDLSARERMRQETVLLNETLQKQREAIDLQRNATELLARQMAQSQLSTGVGKNPLGLTGVGRDAMEGGMVTGALHVGSGSNIETSPFTPGKYTDPKGQLITTLAGFQQLLIDKEIEHLEQNQTYLDNAESNIISQRLTGDKAEFERAAAAQRISSNNANYLSDIQDITRQINGFGAIPAAHGFEGMVNSPTLFLAGEAGREHVSITPNGQRGSGSTVIINVAGSVIRERELFSIMDNMQKSNFKRRGFTGT